MPEITINNPEDHWIATKDIDPRKFVLEMRTTNDCARYLVSTKPQLFILSIVNFAKQIVNNKLPMKIINDETTVIFYSPRATGDKYCEFKYHNMSTNMRKNMKDKLDKIFLKN